MKSLFSYLVLILLLTSCISEKKRAKRCASCPVVTEVVTVEKITSFDTALYISKMGKDLIFENDSSDCCVLVNALMEAMAESNDTIKAKKDGIKSSIFKDKAKGKIVFRCEADTLKEVIKALRTVKTTSKIETKIIEKPCELEHRNWIDRLARKWLLISLIALSVFGLWKFGPKLLKLL